MIYVVCRKCNIVVKDVEFLEKVKIDISFGGVVRRRIREEV